jgi:hypothetical protein
MLVVVLAAVSIQTPAPPGAPTRFDLLCQGSNTFIRPRRFRRFLHSGTEMPSSAGEF